MPLQEKSTKDPNPEAAPDRGVREKYPEGEHVTGETSTHASANDAIVVDWDGPDDPENPRK